jgi:hypothetical protein
VDVSINVTEVIVVFIASLKVKTTGAEAALGGTVKTIVGVACDCGRIRNKATSTSRPTR